jgi:uncharacterized RDD family membrane protein YckC
MTANPQRDTFETGRPAGFVSRLIALVIDLAILVAIVTTVTVVGQFLGTSLGVSKRTLRLLALLTAVFAALLYFFYFALGNVLGGQTVGKRIMGLRVVRTDGSRVKFWRSVKRIIGMIISLPLFWGYLIVLIDNRRQAFHDKLARTIVIYYSVPKGELGPFEQNLNAIRIRRERRLAAERAADAAAAQSAPLPPASDSPTG